MTACFSFCTDNAAMIAAAGYFLLQGKEYSATDPFITSATLPLSELMTLKNQAPEEVR
jgi:tRNA A37 threonylcarbamoyltransferase TsaD